MTLSCYRGPWHGVSLSEVSGSRWGYIFVVRGKKKKKRKEK